MRVLMHDFHRPSLAKPGKRAQRVGLSVLLAAVLGVLYLSMPVEHTAAVMQSNLGFSPARDVSIDLTPLLIPLGFTTAESGSLDNNGMEYLPTFSK